MATQFDTVLDVPSTKDQDMISDAGDIDLDLDFINTDQLDQDITLEDGSIGEQLADEFMDDGLDNNTSFEAQMHDDEIGYDEPLHDVDGNQDIEFEEPNAHDMEDATITFDTHQTDIELADDLSLVTSAIAPEIDISQQSLKTEQHHDAPVAQDSSVDTVTLANTTDNPQDDVLDQTHSVTEYSTDQINTQQTSPKQLLSPATAAELDHKDSFSAAENQEEHDESAQAAAEVAVWTHEISHVQDNADEVDDKTSHHEADYSDLDYNAILTYNDVAMSLFPPSSSGLPDTYMLNDSSLAERPLPELFHACRDTLGTTISGEQALRINVPCLDLIIHEHDSDCETMTISQIIDVYYHLNSNDEVYEPPFLGISISIVPKLSTKLNELFKMAEIGNGMNHIQSNGVELKEDNVAEAAEEEEVEEAEINYEQDEKDKPKQTDNLNPLVSEDYSQAGVNSLEPTETIPEIPTTLPLIADEANDSEATIQPITNSSKTLTPTNVESEVSFVPDSLAEDDLIDYSDDEEEESHVAPVESSRSSTIQDDGGENTLISETAAISEQHVDSDTFNGLQSTLTGEDQEDFLLDIGEQQEDFEEDHDHFDHQQYDNDNAVQGDDSRVAEDDGLDLQLDFEKSFEPEADEKAVSKNEDDIEPTVSKSQATNSPSVKRSWEEHSEIQDGEIEQDIKRVKSDQT